MVLNETQLENVKHVIFGLQKQANVTNEAVVKIVSTGLVQAMGENCIDTEQSTVDSIKAYLESLLSGEVSPNKILVMLVAGEESLAMLNADGPKVVTVDQPNPESPKNVFRINLLGAALDDIKTDVDVPMDAPVGTTEEPTEHREGWSMQQEVEHIKSEILKVTPETVKQELAGNEWAQALYCAKEYYRHM